MLHMDKRLVVPITESQHRALKLKPANTGQSIKKIVLNALAASGAIRYQPPEKPESSK